MPLGVFIRDLDHRRQTQLKRALLGDEGEILDHDFDDLLGLRFDGGAPPQPHDSRHRNHDASDPAISMRHEHLHDLL